MFVRIIIYADESNIAYKLISGRHIKKVVKPIKPAKTEIKNTLAAAIEAIKLIKYPVEIEIVSSEQKLGYIMTEGLERHDYKEKIRENLEEWKELYQLINEHQYYSFSYYERRKEGRKEYEKLERDCLYRRYTEEKKD
jgi:hypothetical protein